MTNESENALPLDNTFWDYWLHSKVMVAIPVTEDKVMNVIGVLKDIYDSVDDDTEETKRLIIMMAAILLASKDNQAEQVYQEMVVSESMMKFDKQMKEILNEKQ